MADGSEVIVVIATPAGMLRIAGGVSRRQRVLHVTRAHIEGLKPVEAATDDPESVIAELSRLNVHAAVMETPEI